MKLVIFAGGIGTRLWPLSREKSPKQFDKIFNGYSTLQLAISRVEPEFGIDNIFIQTTEQFKKIIKEQIPQVKEENIINEPVRRNLGPAVCLAVSELAKQGHTGPMAILWADHLMDRPDEFIRALLAGRDLIKEKSDRFVFLGERPRFSNNNLGWMKIGKRLGTVSETNYYEFAGWKYKPSSEECNKLFRSNRAYWNPGYFITSINFLSNLYKELAPQIYDRVANDNYEEAEAIHFDRAIIEKVDLSKAVVIKTYMGWSDPGTLYALKEALQKSQEANVVSGEVSLLDVSDSLVYNLEKGKLITAIGLSGMVIVNTRDALVVVPRDEVVRVTELVKKLKTEGRTKFL